MSGYSRRTRQNQHPPDGPPVNKKPRIGVADLCDTTTDEDPFADDITGEEWELAASQAEMNHTREVSELKTNGKIQPSTLQGGGDSSKHPQFPPSQRSHYLATNSNKKLVDELKTKLSVYEKKITELESAYNRKNGETLILRDRLANSEKQVNQEKLKILEMQNYRDQQDSEREKVMQKEIEKYKDEMQFKQVEIMESQNLIRNLEGKIRSLEDQKSPKSSKKPGNPSSSGHGEGLPMGGWTKASNIALLGNAPKKIRLVKPESPRYSARNLLNNAEFSDDPLDNKKIGRASLSTDARSSVAPKAQTSELSEAQLPASSTSFKLNSKVLCKDSLGQGLLRGLISSHQSSSTSEPKLPSFLQILSLECDGHDLVATRGAVENLKQYLVTNQGCIKLFKQSDDESLKEHVSGMLTLIYKHLQNFTSLHEASENGRIISQESSYHTAPSQESKQSFTVALKNSRKLNAGDMRTICMNTLSSLHALRVLFEYLPELCLVQENVDLVAIIFKLCDFSRWSPRVEFSDEILILILEILNICVKYPNDKNLENFSRSQVLLPLLTHNNIQVKCRLMDVLISVLRINPAFAASVLKPDMELPSVLCHLTDLMCLQNLENADSWLDLQRKILSCLSILTAEHQSLLMQYSCFSEIYHGVDSLIYNQLTLWKTDAQPHDKRHLVIKSALCLLHSCANVYPDGIPGSRRQHSHQFTLTMLNEFLKKDRDHDSFWNIELGGIVDSEVETII